MGYIENVESVKTPAKIWELMRTNIVELAKVKGISLADIEKEIGVGRGYLGKDREDIPVTRALKIAEMLDCKAEQLWDERFTAQARKMAIDVEIERLKELRKKYED